MVIMQFRANRKLTGGKYKSTRIKRLHRMGNAAMLTKIDDKMLITVKMKGGGMKNKLHSIDVVNVYDPATKKHSVEKIITTTGNPANRHFARRNIITKGSVLDTAKGKARITSRPGQEGTINAVLIEKKEK
ncbi:MAG: 30S ribosomal protein S8e [Nanoarchaeota archaeon]